MILRGDTLRRCSVAWRMASLWRTVLRWAICASKVCRCCLLRSAAASRSRSARASLLALSASHCSSNSFSTTPPGPSISWIDGDHTILRWHSYVHCALRCRIICFSCSCADRSNVTAYTHCGKKKYQNVEQWGWRLCIGRCGLGVSRRTSFSSLVFAARSSWLFSAQCW